MAMTDWTIIRRSMASRMFSTVTTVVTVAVAVSLMLVLLSMRDAGQRAFERGGGNVQLVISAERDPMTAVLNNIFYARPPRDFIYWDRYQKLRESYPFEFAVPMQQGDSFRGFPVLATTPEFLGRVEPVAGRRWAAAQGSFFDNDFEAVLGASVARAPGLKMGDQVVLTHGAPAATPGGAEAAHEHALYK